MNSSSPLAVPGVLYSVLILFCARRSLFPSLTIIERSFFFVLLSAAYAAGVAACANVADLGALLYSLLWHFCFAATATTKSITTTAPKSATQTAK